MTPEILSKTPLILAIAGSNGAGKTTFYSTFLASRGLPFINADVMALAHHLDAYDAAELAQKLRARMVDLRRSFVFETVLSDPDGEKVAFLRSAADSGYTVVLCFIALESVEISSERVAMRVLQNGHDVPGEKLHARFPRTLENLKRAVVALPNVFIYDNSDLSSPYKLVATSRNGRVDLAENCPAWLKSTLTW
ncbi:MAG TPA: zeta toxin family protein [Planctomycetota bacterium]|nr:zeta toxin family protein [Planctomycetota bacterium]